jgi:DNA invertase Pin-like site-specific DNA recombinase
MAHARNHFFTPTRRHRDYLRQLRRLRKDADGAKKPCNPVLDQHPLQHKSGSSEMPSQRKPKAYSYTRFSTPEQAKGDSTARQTLAAQRWAEQHGVELDAELTFRDEGVSAFDGDNVERGALGAFLQAVQCEDVPRGSWLLVESLDRLSRQKPLRAATFMSTIIALGVTVVDLFDGAREYNTHALDSDSTLLLTMIIRFIRANEESALKSARVAAARKRAREAFASDEPLTKAYTKQLPAWLLWNDETKRIEPIPERADVVRKVFELADTGWGQHRIAGWLNEHVGEPWGRGKRKGARWHRSYVRKLLTNRAVVGTFTPHIIERDPNTRRKVRKALDAINHRFPPIIEPELFERVSNQVGVTAPRGRHAGMQTRSIFAGLLKCRHCGGTMIRISKGDYAYLVCSAANSKPRTCHYETVPYDQAEEAFVHSIRLLIDEAPRGKDTADLEREIAMADGEIDARLDKVQELLALSIEEKSVAARSNLKRNEQELTEAEERARALRARRDRLATIGVLRRLQAIEATLTETPLHPARANKVLREAVAKMIMLPAEGLISVYWRHADEPQEMFFATSRFDWDPETSKEPIGGEQTDNPADAG